MANLKSSDKIKLENYLEMKGGYVCDFTNRTFGDFVLEHTGVDVYAGEYSGSKANRLRALWDKESSYRVAKLLSEMLEYWKLRKATPLYGYHVFNPALHEECKKIVARLQGEAPIENVDALTPNSNEKDFDILAQSIRQSIEKNQPEEALDRLHTFVVKYMREICSRHSISYQESTPLHSLFGGYIKYLATKDLIESDMSERILKSSISILDAFNSVRNNQSLAHDNPILNYNESVLIFNNISNTIRFVEYTERRLSEKEKSQPRETPKEKVAWNDLEFSDEEIDAAGDAWIQSELDIRRGK